MFCYKHFLIASLMVMAPLAIFAQFQQGTKSIGLNGFLQLDRPHAQVRFQSNGDSVMTQEKRDGYGASFSFHHFLSDKVALGLGLGFNRGYRSRPHRDEGIWGERENWNTTFTIQPQLRYFYPVHGKLSLFLQNYLNFQQTQVKEAFLNNGEEQTLESSTMRFGLGLDPGLVFMLKERWGIEAFVPGISLDLGIASREDEQDKSMSINLRNTFSLNNIHWGFRYYFN